MNNNRTIFVFFLIFALILSGCTHTTTDPTLPFIEVRNDVFYRTNYCITQTPSCPCEEWIEEALQEELTLDNVIWIALINNQSLQAVYEEIGIAQADLVQSQLFQNPIFSISLRYENLVDAASIIEAGLVQNFLDILLKPLKRKLAIAELEAVKSEVAAKVLDIIAETKIAFHSMQAAKTILNLQNQELAALEASYDAAQRLYQAGNIQKLELLTKHSGYEKSKIAVSKAEVALFEAREKLNVLMGLWCYHSNWDLASSLLELPDEWEGCSSAVELAIENSLDLKIARQRIYATAYLWGIDTTQIIFPEFTFGPDSEKEPEDTWFFGPQFSIGIPIFDLGQAKRAAACAELTKLWKEYWALSIEIRSAVRSANFRMINALKQYKKYQETIIPLCEHVTDETLLQLNAMQLGVFDLLSTKQSEINTKVSSVLSYRDYWIARTEVEMLMSGRMIHNTSMKVMQ